MEENQLLKSFLSDVKIRQKRTTLLLTSFSIGLVILGSSVLLYSSSQVRKKLDQLNYLDQRLQETQRQLKNAEAALKDATELKRSVVPLDFLDIKSVAVKDPRAYEVLGRILATNRIPWRLNGKSPEEGFDSPGYAAYILNEVGRTQINLSEAGTVSIKRQLLDKLEPKDVNAPLQSGDLVLYHDGYAMFYYKIDLKSGSGRFLETREFVVGMTPLGVTALKENFAPFEHILKSF